MWRKLVALVFTMNILVGGVATTATASTKYKAANHELSTYWSQWRKHPDSYFLVVIVLTLYHWPTQRSSSLAHKLAYELEAYESGTDLTGDWRVTYLMLQSSLGEVNPLT